MLNSGKFLNINLIDKLIGVLVYWTILAYCNIAN